MAPAPARRGFVLPLALFMLTAIALLAALMIEGAVQEVRIARGEVAGARADASAGSALADLLASTPDSAMLMSPRGAIVSSSSVAGSDSVHVAVQSLGGGLVRVTASARSWWGGARGDATTVGFARIDRALFGAPGTLSYQRLPGWWWTRIP